MFPKCIISKISRLRRATLPANVQFVLRASTAHSIIFSNLQAAIALSTHAQNVFYKLVGALRLGYIIFTGGYRALYTCTKRVYKVWLGRGRNVIIFDSRASTALSTHAQNACKQKYFVRKMRRRRENFEIQELKRSFLVLKTRKIDLNTVKNSSKIAPKARKNFGGILAISGESMFSVAKPPPLFDSFF